MAPDALNVTFSTESTFSMSDEEDQSPQQQRGSAARRLRAAISTRRLSGGHRTSSLHSRLPSRRRRSSDPTAETIEDLRDSVKVLMQSQRQLLQRDVDNNKCETLAMKSSRGMLSEDIGDAVERDDLDDGVLERMCVRMDGLEVYAVVSALTVATSLAVAESYRHDSANDGSWAQMYHHGQHVELLCRAIFLMSSAASALLGLHSTLVFSLITMYGRTAVGMDNMPAFKSFYESTAKQRYRGFHAFLYSIYAFLVQIVLVVTAKCPEHNRVYPLLGFVMASLAVRLIYRDTEHIVKNAGIIFAPRRVKPRSRTSMMWQNQHGRPPKLT